MKRYSLMLVLGTVLLIGSAASTQERFLGSVSLVPYNFAPFGSALCNGQLLSISQHTALFSLLGTSFGGDSITTFALPDLRGRVVLHQGQGAGLQSYSFGQPGGEESVSLNVAQLPSHSHTAVASSSVGNTVTPNGDTWAVGPRALLYSAPSNLTAMAPLAVSANGSSAPHENRKPFLTLNYVIWLQGIFPSRP